jgi:hypothetical protein
MMFNTVRSGSIPDKSDSGKEPTARESDRSGKVGDNAVRRNFTIQPKTAVIEISGGRVEVKVGKSRDTAQS